MREWLVAGGLVESHDGLLLVQNRRRDGSLDWSPPGGVIDVMKNCFRFSPRFWKSSSSPARTVAANSSYCAGRSRMLLIAAPIESLKRETICERR